MSLLTSRSARGSFWRTTAAAVLLLAAPACGGNSGATPGHDGGPDLPAMTNDGSGHNDTTPPEKDVSGNDPGGDAPSDSQQLDSQQLDVPRLDVPPPGDVAGTDGAFRLPTMTMEALQVAGTHNSYHQAPIIAFDASHAYTQKPLDQQLNGGVRALELDLHLANDGSYDIYHLTLIDPNSSCPKLDGCLNIIATWSASHPRHVPIVLWFELKDANGGQPINDLVPVEAALLKAFPREKIITPAWLCLAPRTGHDGGLADAGRGARQDHVRAHHPRRAHQGL